MKHIFEEYGDTILQIIGGLFVLGLILDLLRDGGSLNELVKQILERAC